jgi:hypothetical protein
MGNCGTKKYGDPDSGIKKLVSIENLECPALHEGSVLGITRLLSHTLFDYYVYFTIFQYGMRQFMLMQ